VENVHAVMSAAAANIAKTMAAKTKDLIALAVHMAAIAGIAETNAPAIVTSALTRGLAEAKHVEKNSYVQTSAIVPSTIRVSTHGKNALKTLNGRKNLKVIFKGPMTNPTLVRARLAMAQRNPTPVMKKKILRWKKEKST
jgi:hypothetical protein